MPEWMIWLLVALAALNLVLMVLLLMRPRGAEGFARRLRDDAERESRELRAEVQDSAREHARRSSPRRWRCSSRRC